MYSLMYLALGFGHLIVRLMYPITGSNRPILSRAHPTVPRGMNCRSLELHPSLFSRDPVRLLNARALQ